MASTAAALSVEPTVCVVNRSRTNVMLSSCALTSIGGRVTRCAWTAARSDAAICCSRQIHLLRGRRQTPARGPPVVTSTESVSGRQHVTEGPIPCGRPRAGDDAVHGRDYQGGAARAPHRAEPVQANAAGGTCGVFKHMHHKFDNVVNNHETYKEYVYAPACCQAGPALRCPHVCVCWRVMCMCEVWQSASRTPLPGPLHLTPTDMSALQVHARSCSKGEGGAWCAGRGGVRQARAQGLARAADAGQRAAQHPGVPGGCWRVPARAVWHCFSRLFQQVSNWPERYSADN